MLANTDFAKKCKLPILWTIGYLFTVWLIFHILFHFEIFSYTNWAKVSMTHLHGLGGFTFCLMVFATIPLYLATLTLVIRNQKPLISLPLPKFITNFIEKLFSKETQDSNSDNTEKNESEIDTTINDGLGQIPAEMRGAFIRARARKTSGNDPICSVCSVSPNIYQNSDTKPTPPNELDDNIPLPPDFDFDNNDAILPDPKAPVFQDINFYDDTPDVQESDTSPENDVTKYLTKTNRNFTICQDDIILTDNAAIAVHDDNDFWIMDEPTWFAAGKTRESPISKLLDIAKKHNVMATLYLGSTNIMQYEEKRKDWESSGIHIVTKPQDL